LPGLILFWSTRQAVENRPADNNQTLWWLFQVNQCIAGLAQRHAGRRPRWLATCGDNELLGTIVPAVKRPFWRAAGAGKILLLDDGTLIRRLSRIDAAVRPPMTFRS